MFTASPNTTALVSTATVSYSGDRRRDFAELIEVLREFYLVLFDRETRLDSLIYVLSAIIFEKTQCLSSSRRKSFRALTRDYFLMRLREFMLKYLNDLNALTLEEKKLLLRAKSRLSCSLHFNHDLTSVLMSSRNSASATTSDSTCDFTTRRTGYNNSGSDPVVDDYVSVAKTAIRSAYKSNQGNRFRLVDEDDEDDATRRVAAIDLLNSVIGKSVVYYDECGVGGNDRSGEIGTSETLNILRRRNVYSIETLRSTFVLYTVTSLSERAKLSCGERPLFGTLSKLSRSTIRRKRSVGRRSRRTDADKDDDEDNDDDELDDDENDSDNNHGEDDDDTNDTILTRANIKSSRNRFSETAIFLPPNAKRWAELVNRGNRGGYGGIGDSAYRQIIVKNTKDILNHRTISNLLNKSEQYIEKTRSQQRRRNSTTTKRQSFESAISLVTSVAGTSGGVGGGGGGGGGGGTIDTKIRSGRSRHNGDEEDVYAILGDREDTASAATTSYNKVKRSNPLVVFHDDWKYKSDIDFWVKRSTTHGEFAVENEDSASFANGDHHRNLQGYRNKFNALIDRFGMNWSKLHYFEPYVFDRPSS